jgi:hypothetical protein
MQALLGRSLQVLSLVCRVKYQQSYAFLSLEWHDG